MTRRLALIMRSQLAFQRPSWVKLGKARNLSSLRDRGADQGGRDGKRVCRGRRLVHETSSVLLPVLVVEATQRGAFLPHKDIGAPCSVRLAFVRKP